MNRKSTILWRMAVLGLIASLVPLGIYALERHNQVDTENMIDVSVSIRTMSHVTVDKFGDSVWEVNNGSGFIVSTRNCEVWTNHHVIADAALVEVFPRGAGCGDCADGLHARPAGGGPDSPGACDAALALSGVRGGVFSVAAGNDHRDGE